jgi:hypothetical protein
LPNWWLPCYDLSTEFHLFVEEYQRRYALQYQPDSNVSLPSTSSISSLISENRWIIKPAQGTRGQGHRIVDFYHVSSSVPIEEQLQYIATLSPLIPLRDLPLPISPSLQTEYLTTGEITDRVAQLLVTYPLLLHQKKFDCRYYVFVRSFEPFEAYLHELYYARLANKIYEIALLQDQEVALTVSAYDENKEIAGKQERCLYTEIPSILKADYGEGVIDIDTMKDKTFQMFQDIFGNAGNHEIGHWPNSSAYYGIDVIYDASEYYNAITNHTATAYLEPSQPLPRPQQRFVPEPKLLEINFMGDWHGLEVAVGDQLELYYQWVEDLLTVLATKVDLNNHPRLTRL